MKAKQPKMSIHGMTPDNWAAIAWQKLRDDLPKMAINPEEFEEAITKYITPTNRRADLKNFLSGYFLLAFKKAPPYVIQYLYSHIGWYPVTQTGDDQDLLRQQVIVVNKLVYGFLADGISLIVHFEMNSDEYLLDHVQTILYLLYTLQPDSQLLTSS